MFCNILNISYALHGPLPCICTQFLNRFQFQFTCLQVPMSCICMISLNQFQPYLHAYKDLCHVFSCFLSQFPFLLIFLHRHVPSTCIWSFIMVSLNPFRFKYMLFHAYRHMPNICMFSSKSVNFTFCMLMQTHFMYLCMPFSFHQWTSMGISSTHSPWDAL